jgi:hypothetical protein
MSPLIDYATTRYYHCHRFHPYHANAVSKMGKKGRKRLTTNTDGVKSAQPVKIPGLTLVDPSEDSDKFVGQALLDALDALEEQPISSKPSVTNRQSNRNTGSLAKGRKSKAPRKAGKSRHNSVKGTVTDGQPQHLPTATGNEHEYLGGVSLFNIDQPAPMKPSSQISEISTGSVVNPQLNQQNEIPTGRGMAFQFQSTWPSVQPFTVRNQQTQTIVSAQGWNRSVQQNLETQQTNKQPTLYDTYAMQSYGVPMYDVQQSFPWAPNPDNFAGMANSNNVSGSRWPLSSLSTHKVLPEPGKGQRYNLRGRNLSRHPPTPTPTEPYLLQSSTAPKQLHRTKPQKLLIILDLNGVLLFRPNKKNPKNITPREHLEEFLAYLFENHKVMIWSSARPDNVAAMCQQIFTEEQRAKLVAEWARDKLRLTNGQYDNKVQVYKQLSWVWEDSSVQQKTASWRQGKWDQSNTVLIDDTALKAAAEPYNLIEVPEFGLKGDKHNDGVLSQVVGYLEELKYTGNVSYFMRAKPFIVDGGWKFQWRNS